MAALTGLRILALSLVALSVAPAADAAPRKLPSGFFGTVLDPPVTVLGATPDQTLDEQFGRMRSSGVESTRVTFSWSTANPQPGVFDWREIDRLVLAGARNRIELLPIVQYTPAWASSAPPAAGTGAQPPVTNYPPRSPGLYADFMTALVRRYGPKGTWYAEHPEVSKAVRIRRWQVWNEPMQPYYWATQPRWWTTYAPMLKAAHTAVHRVDKGAVVTTAALSGSNAGPSWEDLEHIYQTVGRNAFDAVAINQYTNAEGARFTNGKPLNARQSVDHLLQIGFYVRQEMRRRGDRRKPIYLTEFGWPAAFGKVPRNKLLGLETTPSGAAKRFTGFVQRLAKRGTYPSPTGDRRRLKVGDLRIERAYWYTWATGFDRAPRQSPFDYSGLNQWLLGSPFSAEPLLATFKRLAKRY